MGCVRKQSFARRYPGLRRVHAPEPVSHVPVLRGILPPRKSRAAGATIVVESSPHHSWSVQARRGTPVLHAPRDFRAVGQAGACAALSRPCVSEREGHDADPAIAGHVPLRRCSVTRLSSTSRGRLRSSCSAVCSGSVVAPSLLRLSISTMRAVFAPLTASGCA